MNAPDVCSVREPTTAAVKLRDDLIFTPDLDANPPCYAIEDPLRRRFYRVGIPEFTFIALLDGRTSVANALGFAARKLGRQALAEQEALALCRWLLDCQLAHTAESAQAAKLCESAEKKARQRLVARINPLVVKVPLLNPDRLLAVLGPWLWWLLSAWFFVVWCAVCLWALCLVARGWDRFTASAAVILDRENWLRLAAAWAMLKVLHEFWHGLVCKKYGGSVPAVGVTFLFFAPLAYVDVTSSWRFRSKWQRIATAAAGMYVELLAAAISVIFWSNTSGGPAHHMALNVAMMAGLNAVLFNGNPLIRFDGYFILSDLLEIPNLYSSGQQYLGYLLQTYVLGRAAPLPNWPPRKAALIAVYGVAALAWRVLFYLTLALALVGMFSYFGGVLALGLLVCGWGLPAIRAIKLLGGTSRCQPVCRWRVAIAAAVGLGLAVLGASLLARPGAVESPAVVEYAPLSVVRAVSPGVVREIRVRSGDLVEAGQSIAVLENPELMAELADLRLASEQSVLKGRMYQQDEQLGKSQVERANQEALEKKMAETQTRIDNLTVRAPVRGHVFARNLESLLGRYLQVGTEVAIVGNETVKELLIAVYQDDVDLFTAHLGETVDVRMRGDSGKRFPARLVKVNPCANAELPHPALAAPRGGPLAVRIKAAAQDSSERSGGDYELLTPAFIVKAELQPEQGTLVHAGQLATVKFRSATETSAGRLIRSTRAWIQRQMTASKRRQDGSSAGS